MSEIVTIDHDGLVYETDDAKLFEIDDEKVWIPKSLISDEDDESVDVPEWFAEKEGLI